MTNRAERNKWSKGTKREDIVDQRAYMWREDTIRMYAKWLGLKQGMTAVDVGCGLAYLGRTFWQYFGKGGSYCGLDLSDRLVKDASQSEKKWVIDGTPFFCVADAYAIPIDDASADIAMCQTLLMHLEYPERALDEMIRITKPGGVVMCMEPDNISSELRLRYSSLSTPEMNELLQEHKSSLIMAEGRRTRGKGDWGIGIKIPKMMADSGLVQIDIRGNDIVHFIQPPYESPRQEFELEMMKKRVAENEIPKEVIQECKENYLAGGGSLSSFYRYWKRVLEMHSRIRRIGREQAVNRSVYYSHSGSALFCTRGFKPL